MQLIAGRNFKPDEIGVREPRSTQWPAGIIITRALARKLFGDEAATGKQVYIDIKAAPLTVLGVDRSLADAVAAQSQPFRRCQHRRILDAGAAVRQLRQPDRLSGARRTGRRDEVMKVVEAKLAESNRGRIVEGIDSLANIRAKAYAEDRAMTLILGGVIVALLSITALGIVGMASFWVGQRTKQIGTRRALGATRFDILRYFLTENFLMTTIGLALGVVLTYALNLWLMAHYHSPLLPWFYVPVGRDLPVAARPAGRARPGQTRVARAARGGDAVGMTAREPVSASRARWTPRTRRRPFSRHAAKLAATFSPDGASHSRMRSHHSANEAMRTVW